MLSLDEFGTLIIFQATVTILTEVAGGGMGEVLIRNVARDPRSCRQSILDFAVIAVPTGALAIAVNAGVHALLFGAGPLFVLGALYGLFEIIGQRTITFWELVAIGHRHTHRADLLRLIPATMKMVALAGVYFLGDHDLSTVSVAFIVSGMIAALGFSVAGLRRYGTPSGVIRLSGLRIGVPFALNQLLRAAQQNLDRVLLKVILSASDVALYAAAMRILQVAFLPVMTMLRMWYPRIFAAGAESPQALHTLFLRLLKIGMAIAAASALVTFAVAPLLPLLIGEQFGRSVYLLQIAAPTLLLTAASYLAADVLTGSDRQYLRVSFFAVSVAVQVVVAVLLCPRMGAPGAVVAVYCSSALFAFLCWSAASRLRAARKTH
jgi:O-antigen/teichoic acid export membrane protein